MRKTVHTILSCTTGPKDINGAARILSTNSNPFQKNKNTYLNHLPHTKIDSMHSDSILNSPSDDLIRKSSRIFDSPITQIYSFRIPLSSTTCLAAYFPSWVSITTDLWVLSIISIGYAIEFLPLPPSGVVLTTSSNALEQEIQPLFSKDSILVVIPQDDDLGFFSRYFFVPKRDGGLQPILDLWDLNCFIL